MVFCIDHGGYRNPELESEHRCVVGVLQAVSNMVVDNSGTKFQPTGGV